MDLISILTLVVSNTLVYSAPLIFAGLGGTFSERGGIVNVGIEGIMVMGAFSSIVFNLSFAETFGAATPWLWTFGRWINWGLILFNSCTSNGSFTCRSHYFWYGS